MDMTTEEIFAAIDLAISSRWELIIAQQEAFLAATGSYWQGLETHSVIPANGAATAPDLAGQTPTDQPFSWLDMQGLPPEMSAALRCDIYAGPMGKGYVLTASVEVDGVFYEKAINVGPDTSRAHEWADRPADSGF